MKLLAKMPRSPFDPSTSEIIQNIPELTVTSTRQHLKTTKFPPGPFKVTCILPTFTKNQLPTMSLLMILPRYPSPPANIIGNYFDKHLLKIKKHLPTLTNSKLPTMSLLTTLPRSPFPPATCVRTYGDRHLLRLTITFKHLPTANFP